jgi:hypothetical protein
MYEVLSMIFIKFKVAIYSIMAAYVAATMRYFRQKRLNRKPSFKGWFAFGATSFLVTYAFFSLTEHMAVEAGENIKLALGFWVGYMADFFYSWVPNYIKSKLPNGVNIDEVETDNK